MLAPKFSCDSIADFNQYVVFCGLRNHGELTGRLVSELVYIHSKMLIVDDRRALIGSANINDRSQLGDRDSEMALYFEDVEFVEGKMNGQPFQSGKFCGSLRRHCFSEHLGLLEHPEWRKEIDIEDPIVDSFYQQIRRIAASNTEIYEKVFRCLPTDEILNYEMMAEYKERQPLAKFQPQVAQQMLNDVRGHLVLFPTRFLCETSLVPSVMNKEGRAKMMTKEGLTSMMTKEGLSPLAPEDLFT